MLEQMKLRAGSADIVIMNAAVADYFIPNPETAKIKKTSDNLTIELNKTADILSLLSANKPVKQYLVGFAAETTDSDEEIVSLAKNKLQSKNADLIVGNRVSSTLGINSDENQAIMVSKDEAISLAKSDKLILADAIWDFIVKDMTKVGQVSKSPVEPDLA
jgi:phosphopantothenoylcysteine decarboxylase/phosphopantothenate--cysteine ligase